MAQPLRDSLRHCGVVRIKSQRFLRRGKLMDRLRRLQLRFGKPFLLLLEFLFVLHRSIGFIKQDSERFPCPVQFPAYRIRRLFCERADFFVAQFLVRHEQQQQAVFFR